MTRSVFTRPNLNFGDDMNRIVYVNGDYLPEDQAKISVFDRGFLMADGVYEVTAVLDGKLLDFQGHLTRLARSLDELQIAVPANNDELLHIHRDMVRLNKLDEGMIYLQVTRGVADRDFVWPKDAKPTLIMFTQEKEIEETLQARNGIKVATIPDIRWARRDIKTVQLLAPSWCKMQAKAKGADDAWMVEDGFVTEGTSNNAWIITKEGKIITRDLTNSILHGITRSMVIGYAAKEGFNIEQRPFSVAEAKNAAEAFITASSTFVCPVVQIDDAIIGTGRPGATTLKLRELYIAESRKSAI